MIKSLLKNTVDDEGPYKYNGTIKNSVEFVPGKKGNGLRLHGVSGDFSTGGHVILPMINFIYSKDLY
jgi:hypothetical protein